MRGLRKGEKWWNWGIPTPSRSLLMGQLRVTGWQRNQPTFYHRSGRRNRTAASTKACATTDATSQDAAVIVEFTLNGTVKMCTYSIRLCMFNKGKTTTWIYISKGIIAS